MVNAEARITVSLVEMVKHVYSESTNERMFATRPKPMQIFLAFKFEA
jgi:hypothetical protein